MTHSLENSPARRVVVTGAGGNLGAKAVEALAKAPWCDKVIGFYSPNRRPIVPADIADKVEIVIADLTDANGAWRDHVLDADAVVHFAAKNPVPESSWSDAASSFDMTANLGIASLQHGVRRFVFCSSNHAMGGYKDSPLNETMSAGGLVETLPPAPGTRWNDGQKQIDSTPYGASKVMGESFTAALAAGSGGCMSAISLRVGWALPGDNDPADISVSGSPTGQGSTTAQGIEEAHTLRWFQGMWLSNGDFERLLFASILAQSATWPTPGIIVNGVSANDGSLWSLDAAEQLIGYVARDNLYALIAQA